MPNGYEIHSWNKGHYDCSAVIKDNVGRYIYMSISDVRYFINNWIDNILIRTMKHEKDQTGGDNHYTDLINLTKDIARLY